MSTSKFLIRSFLTVAALAAGLVPAWGQANTNCTPSGTTFTCSGAAGAKITSTGSGWKPASDNYPTQFTISGVTGTVTSAVVTLHGLSADGNTGFCLGDAILILVSGTRNLVLMNEAGNQSCSTTTNSITNLTLTFTDAGTPLTGSTNFPATGTLSVAPGTGSVTTETIPSPAPSSPNEPAPTGTSTLASAFTNASANGVWALYLIDGATSVDTEKFISWDLTLTVSNTTTPTTTTVSPSIAGPELTTGSVTYTATVTATSGTPTGTVAFTDTLPGGSAVGIAGCGSVVLSGGQAACPASITTEGNHTITANYSPTGSFGSSSGTVQETYRHATTNTGLQYCNPGSLGIPGTAQAIYPSYINVTGQGNSVASLSVTLNGVQTGTSLQNTQMMLVAPSWTPANKQALEFFSEAGPATGGQSSANITLTDGSSLAPKTNIPSGTFGPTSYTNNFPDFYPAPAPSAGSGQPPTQFFQAATTGTASFETTFSGATTNGNWLLYVQNSDSASPVTLTGGWCINFTLNSGTPTTTTVTSSATPNATLGTAVSFTATVSASPTPNEGTVTFTENGAPLTGAPNSGVANVSNGVASISTTSLPEGDHTITATYTDSSHAFNNSFGTVTIRVDKATSTPTLSGSTWSYCNTGVISIPAVSVAPGDVGPAAPNPSNINVGNLPGTISSLTLTLNSFQYDRPVSLESLLVGPNGASAPTTTQTFDFFSLAGGTGTFGPQTTTFTDSSATTSSSAPPSASAGPASYGATSYTASPFFTLPGSFQHAASSGLFTFNTGIHGVYSGTVPDGLWSLYFNQIINESFSGQGAAGWCLNFIENAVTGTGTTAHTGPASGNNMIEGGTGTVTLSLHNNGDSNSKGSTGDPDQTVAHAMTVTGTLPSGLTLGTVPTGSPWNCVANTTTQVTCTNLNSVAAGSTYTLLSLPVKVASNAGPSATVSGFTFSGAGMTAGTFASDTITINPAPILAIVKNSTGTFTQGGAGEWDIIVSNVSATGSGATDGSTVTFQDTLPTGYILQSTVTGPQWNCTTSTQTVATCTSTSVVAGGGGQFNTIALHVTIPANSPKSVSNTGFAWGGGDLTHTNSGNGVQSTSTVTVVQVPASITLSGDGQSAPINTAFGTPLAATVLDAGSQPIVNQSVTFTAPASGASGKFSNNTNTTTVSTVASPAGQALAGTFTANGTSGAYSVVVTAGSITKNFSLTNTSGPATHFSVTAPGTATAGTPFSITVTALDASNSTATGYSGTIHFTSTDGSAILPANSTLTNGTGTFSSVTLNSAGSRTITATDTVTSSITGTSNSILVGGGTATHFSVTGSSTVTAGVPNLYTVTALDGFNNTVTSYTGTVHFTSSDGAAVLPANYTFVVGDNGVHLFSITLKTAGSQSLTATDTATSSTTGSISVTVNAGAATHFSVTAPGTATAGTPISVTVTALDTFNNTVTGYTGTVHFTSSDAQAVLPANSTLTNGTGSFSVNLKTAGSQAISATDTVTSSITGTSNSITVSAGAATHFSVTAPGTATASTPFNITVTALDGFNNTATGYTGTVHFTSSDGAAVLPGNSTLTNGTGTFSTTLKTGGTQTVTATDTVTSSITGSSGSINVSGTPVLTTVNPNSGQQNQTNLPVALTGQFTHFVQGTSVATFGSGITVNNLTVTDATHATANISIASNATLGASNVTVTTGGEVVTLTNGFTVTNGTPVLISATPNSGQQGQSNLPVALTGQFTHFVQGTSVATFGSGITVNNLTVTDATHATANISIASNATLGASNVTVTTGGEVVTLTNGFTVTNGTPVLISATPNSGQQGQSNLPVALTGQFTHFVQGTSVATFGSGITVNNLTVTDATHATANISIASNATAGASNVTVTTGGEVVTLTNGFTVTNGTPVLISATPNSGQQSQTLPVALTGQFTHFVQGTSVATFGSGITVNNLTVTDATHATANISIASNATVGASNVTVTTGGEVVTLTNGFTVIVTVVPATVTSLTSTVANGTYGTGAVIPVVVSFSKSVIVSGTPMLALNSGGTASYTSGSGTNALTFTYTVALGQSSAHLDATSTSALTLNGGTITDSSAVAAILTLPAPGAAGSLGANKNIVIGTAGPTVVSFNVLFGSQSYNVLGTTRNRLPWQITGIQVVFSEPITVGNINSLSGAGITTTAFSGLGTNTLTWTITPLTLGIFAANLGGTGVNALQDGGGNGLGSGSGFNQNLKVLYADMNDDGVVNVGDLILEQAAFTQPYNIFADLNGDGLVNISDYLIIRGRQGQTLP